MTEYSPKTQVFPSRINLAEGSVPWYHHDILPSTMDLASRLGKNGAVPWTVVSADSQTKGRGTKGRTWVSHESLGLWCSILLPAPKEPSDMAPVTVLAAEALVQTLRKWTPDGLTIKHPNDVLLNGRKIAGILCESIITGNTVISLVLGMGVNLNQKPEHFEKSGLHEATSLFSETGKTIDAVPFLASFLNVFRVSYASTISMK